MKLVLRQSALFISAAIFIVSLIVHLSTFVPAHAISMKQVGILHILSMGSTFLITPFQAKFSRDWFKLATKKSKMALKFVGAYAVLNFALFAYLMEGHPGESNGKYYIHDHGRKIRDISEDEYIRFNALLTRGFSGHWLIFSLLPFVFFKDVYPQQEKQNNNNS